MPWRNRWWNWGREFDSDPFHLILTEDWQLALMGWGPSANRSRTGNSGLQDPDQQNAEISAVTRQADTKHTDLCTALHAAPAISTALGLRWKTTPLTTEGNRHVENVRWVSFLLMSLFSEFLTHLKTGKAIAILNLKGRGKFSSSYEFSSSFQLWDDWGTLSLRWCMIFPVLCYSFILRLFDGLF